tara:strand:- start:50872 stop:51945 length:1074 start_codon:yes stop_codon:yes gene_type:complete
VIDSSSDSSAKELLGSLAQDAPVALLQIDDSQRVICANLQSQGILGGGLDRLIGRKLSEILFHDCEIFELLDRLMSEVSDVSATGITLCGPFSEPKKFDVRMNIDTASARINIALLPHSKRGGQDPSGLATFARMLGHEIKNPLGGISGAAQLMERSCRADQSELLSLIRSEAMRIGRLIDRFTAFELYNAPRFADLNIHEILDDVVAMQAVASPSVTFKKGFDPSLPEISADRDHLHECILNIVKNAAEAVAGQEYAEVKVSTSYQAGIRLPRPGDERRYSGALLVRIRDNGPGIPSASQEQIFKPFFSTKASGSGIGLSVCQDIAHAHGGRLTFTSRPGRTQFDLVLPLQREPAG